MKNVYLVFTLNGKIIDESDTVTYLGHIYYVIVAKIIKIACANANNCTLEVMSCLGKFTCVLRV